MKQLLPTFVLSAIVFSLFLTIVMYSNEFKTNWYADNETSIETTNR